MAEVETVNTETWRNRQEQRTQKERGAQFRYMDKSVWRWRARLIAWRNMKLFAKPAVKITSLSIKGFLFFGHECRTKIHSGR